MSSSVDTEAKQCDKMPKVLTERDIITNLLKQYETFPCLWDPVNKFYYNKQVRLQCYEKMLETWRQLEPDGTVITLKKKLEHIRASYRREWKKVADKMASKPPPDGVPFVHKPNLWYYHLLSFIHEKKEKDNKDSSEEEAENYRKRQRTESATELYGSSSETDNHHDTNQSSQSQDNQGKSEENDYVTTYGLTIAKQLKELDDEVRYEAERLISDVIYRARTGTLPKYSHSPQAVDVIIPQSEPSWYDIPTEEASVQPTQCVVLVADPSETQTLYATEIDEEIIKTEIDDAHDYTSSLPLE